MFLFYEIDGYYTLKYNTDKFICELFTFKIIILIDCGWVRCVCLHICTDVFFSSYECIMSLLYMHTK